MSRTTEDERHGFTPTLIPEQDAAETGAAFVKCRAFSFFTRLEGYPAATVQGERAAARLPSGQAGKRAFHQNQTLTVVKVGSSWGGWSRKQGGGLGECDKEGLEMAQSLA